MDPGIFTGRTIDGVALRARVLISASPRVLGGVAVACSVRLEPELANSAAMPRTRTRSPVLTGIELNTNMPSDVAGFPSPFGSWT